jgi:putative protease
MLNGDGRQPRKRIVSATDTRGTEKDRVMEGVEAGRRPQERAVELVSPAGTLDKLRIAVLYGADAVYLSGKEYGLRKGAGNFTMEELEAGVNFAHERNCKVYAGVNVFARNDDLNGLSDYARGLSETGIDAVIVADAGAFAIIRENLPDVKVHISTQANVTNWGGVEFWRSLGADRVILSRELSLKEVAEIAAKTSAEIEVFIHGAMCVSYSGRCLLSTYLAERSANQGDCAQPCRWSYRLVPDGGTAENLTAEEDGEGTYLLSSADLCMVDHVRELVDSGIAAMKIEGRMKSLYYVANATRVYREVLETWPRETPKDSLKREWLQELSHLTTRGYTTGFYFGNNAREMQGIQEQSTSADQRFLGLIMENSVDGLMKVRAFNRIQVGQTLQVMSFVRKNDRRCRIKEMWGTHGERVRKAGGGKMVTVQTDTEGFANEILRNI